VVQSFVIFIAFRAGDRTQFQIPARSQIFTLAASTFMKIRFQDYEIEVTDDTAYRTGSTDNNFIYDFVYLDKEASEYKSSNHAIKIFQGGQLIKSAIVCAVGGGTTIHDNSAVVKDDNLYLACADKVFSVSLPDLKLRWTKQADQATCFGIYKADNGLFTHGELSVTRLGTDGQIIWQKGLRDIIVTIDSDKESFIVHEDYIELEDFNRNNYKLDFDGNFIEEKLSDTRIRSNQIDNQRQKRWCKLW
jgi:hypothetical protein